MNLWEWWHVRCSGREPAGYGLPIVVTARPILGSRYGLHWNYAPCGGGFCLRSEATWRNISGVVVNTPRGALWLFFRRWSG